MPEVEIEVREGESLADAIKRQAKALSSQESNSQSPQSTKPAKKEKKVTVTDPSAGQQPEETVYCALHIYQREGEPEGAVRVNGNRERRMHGPNTLIFVHLHQFGQECTPSCKERV